MSAVAGSISVGASVAETSSGFLKKSNSVQYMVEIENFTDQPLELVRYEVHFGYLLLHFIKACLSNCSGYQFDQLMDVFCI